MTPADFANAVIIPTVAEFREKRTDRRHAYLACTVTYHLHDHLAEAAGLGRPEVRVAMKSVCAAQFEIVQTVCLGVKHAQDRRTPIGFIPGKEAERPPAKWGKAKWGRSRWGDAHGGLEVEHQRQRYDLYESVKVVLSAYAGNFPTELGIVDFNAC